MHRSQKENERAIWKDMVLMFLGKLMMRQNYRVCISLETNMFTGLGANGSETDFQNRAHEKHVICS